MADAVSNAFEIERRCVLLKFNTNMPGGGTLGYDGDPNLVPTPPAGTPGENLLYYVAQGATYMESDGTWWRKNILPNNWESVGTRLDQYPYLQEVECLQGDSVNDLVCMRGYPSGSRWRVQKANPRDVTKMPAVGILLSKESSTIGIIQINGPLVGVFSGLDYSKPCFVGDAGISQIAPAPAGLGMYAMIQQVAFCTDTDSVFLTGNTAMVKRKW